MSFVSQKVVFKDSIVGWWNEIYTLSIFWDAVTRDSVAAGTIQVYTRPIVPSNIITCDNVVLVSQDVYAVIVVCYVVIDNVVAIAVPYVNAITIVVCDDVIDNIIVMAKT